MARMGMYVVIVLALLPWGVLAWAAVVRVWAGHDGRLYRLQAEGAVMALVGAAAKWMVFDPNFGFVRHDISRWGEWFDRGERGLFWIGVLLFLLGYVLERRPRRGLAPWPKTMTRLAWSGLLMGACVGLAAYGLGWGAGLAWPFTPGRAAFMIGCLPFALGYAIHDRRARHLTEPE